MEDDLEKLLDEDEGADTIGNIVSRLESKATEVVNGAVLTAAASYTTRQ